ncbi:MAG: hypothetical protein H6617_00550 [Bdellovibrionaceae bacterium]|nr:hypothetical protein [Pseudobdellovibrionaceae bacterium]
MESSTQILKSPEIEDYFVFLGQASSGKQYYEQYGEQLSEWYESGKVIVVPEVVLPWDREFLWSVQYPQTRFFSKMAQPDLLAPLHLSPKERAVRLARHFRERFAGREDLPARHPLHQVFGGDMKKARRYQDMIRQTNEALETFMREMFPRYKTLTGPQISWRFSETRVQDLHLDAYKRKDDNWTLRALINADHVPRVWCTSHSLDTLADKYYRKLEMQKLSHLPPDEFNRHFSNKLFGGVPNSGKDGFPRHICHFGPGSLWLAKTRLIPHQIFFGRRMISIDFEVDPASMGAPELSFKNRIQRIHSKYQ